MTTKRPSSLSLSEEIALSLNLGLPQDSVRCLIDLGTIPSDLICASPGLRDIQMVQIRRLGHKDIVTRPWDWENLLSSMQDGEELLWIALKRRDRVSLHLALKTNAPVIDDLSTVRNRKKRFAAVVGGFYRRAFPESKLDPLTAQEVDAVLSSISEMSTRDCVLVTGIPSPKQLETKTTVQGYRAGRTQERLTQASMTFSKH